MILVPFDPIFAHKIMHYYHDSDYSHFAREMGYWLTLDQCKNLPNLLGREILGIYENDLIGIITLRQEARFVVNFGAVLDKDNQKRGNGDKLLKLVEDYCYRIKGAKTLMVEILKCDSWIGDEMEKRGWKRCGEVPEYNFVDGKLEDVQALYKKLGG